MYRQPRPRSLVHTETHTYTDSSLATAPNNSFALKRAEALLILQHQYTSRSEKREKERGSEVQRLWQLYVYTTRWEKIPGQSHPPSLLPPPSSSLSPSSKARLNTAPQRSLAHWRESSGLFKHTGSGNQLSLSLSPSLSLSLSLSLARSLRLFAARASGSKDNGVGLIALQFDCWLYCISLSLSLSPSLSPSLPLSRSLVRATSHVLHCDAARNFPPLSLAAADTITRCARGKRF